MQGKLQMQMLQLLCNIYIAIVITSVGWMPQVICHAYLWGYKYKLLMYYKHGVDILTFIYFRGDATSVASAALASPIFPWNI